MKRLIIFIAILIGIIAVVLNIRNNDTAKIDIKGLKLGMTYAQWKSAVSGAGKVPLSVSVGENKPMYCYDPIMIGTTKMGFETCHNYSSDYGMISVVETPMVAKAIFNQEGVVVKMEISTSMPGFCIGFYDTKYREWLKKIGENEWYRVCRDPLKESLKLPTREIWKKATKNKFESVHFDDKSIPTREWTNYHFIDKGEAVWGTFAWDMATFNIWPEKDYADFMSKVMGQKNIKDM